MSALIQPQPHKHVIPKRALLALLFVTWGQAAWALDAGAPTFGAGLGDLRVEVVFESLNRDLKVEFDPLLFSAPRLGDTELDPEDGSADSVVRANMFLLRLGLPVGTRGAFHVDGGLADLVDAENTSLTMGGGIDLLLVQRNLLEVTVFGSGVYVFNSEFERKVFDVDLGELNIQGDADFYELGGGLRVAHPFILDEETQIAPYWGLLLSELRGEFDFTGDLSERPSETKGTADIKEEGVFSVILGWAWRMGGTHGLRFEGRLLDQQSFSGAFYAGF